MTNFQFFMLLSTIYIAPRLSPNSSYALASAAMAMAIFCELVWPRN